MVRCSRPRYRYEIDAGDVITSVSDLWSAFARENGAPELTDQQVVGTSLWQFIDGEETRQLYRSLLHRVRTGIPQIILPFRCDSPTLRRFMRLEITAQVNRAIRFEGILERVEPTRRLNLLDPDFPHSSDTLTVCSCCRRVIVDPFGWLEIEEATVRLRLLEVLRVPRLRHRICPDCLALAES